MHIRVCYLRSTVKSNNELMITSKILDNEIMSCVIILINFAKKKRKYAYGVICTRTLYSSECTSIHIVTYGYIG